ncbi:hypothetical protein D3C72_1503800 [compost metagenome]
MLGALGSPGLDQGADQGQVIDVVARADAELALEAGRGELGVAVDLLGLHLGGVVGHHAGAAREAEPLAVRRTQVGGNSLVQPVGVGRLEQAGVLGAPQGSRVGGDEDVGRAVGALGLHAGDQFVGLALDALDVDAGLLREQIVELLVGVIVASSVEVQHPGLSRLVGRAFLLAAGRERQGAQGDGGECDDAKLHGASPAKDRLAVVGLRTFLNVQGAVATSGRSLSTGRNRSLVRRCREGFWTSSLGLLGAMPSVTAKPHPSCSIIASVIRQRKPGLR